MHPRILPTPEFAKTFSAGYPKAHLAENPETAHTVRDSTILLIIHGLQAAHSNIRGDIRNFATQKSPLTPGSSSYGMRSLCAFLTANRNNYSIPTPVIGLKLSMLTCHVLFNSSQAESISLVPCNTSINVLYVKFLKSGGSSFSPTLQQWKSLIWM